jgi:hypothetical protein
MKRIGLVVGLLAIAPLASPAAAEAARYVGKTYQRKTVRIWALSNGRVDFRIRYRSRCIRGGYLSATFYPYRSRRPRLRRPRNPYSPFDGVFFYREAGRYSSTLPTGEQVTYRFRMRGWLYHTRDADPFGPPNGARGRFSIRQLVTDGDICMAGGRWRAGWRQGRLAPRVLAGASQNVAASRRLLKPLLTGSRLLPPRSASVLHD